MFVVLSTSILELTLSLICLPVSQDALSVNTIFSLILAMAFVCHILACGFVAMGKASSEAGVEGWLEFEREVRMRTLFADHFI